MTLPTIDTNYFTTFLVDLLNIPSPTGFAEPAIEFVEKELSKYKQLQLSRTRKGALVAKWQVESDLPPVALTAHVDTLGAVVKEIKSNGRLKLSRIGGIQWPSCGNRRRVDIHIQRRKDSRLGVNRYGVRSCLWRGRK